MKTKYKVIAIGSGPGSSVAASEIANKGIEVLMLEMGNDFRETSFTEYSTDEIASKYKNAGQTVSLGNSIINYAEGMCLGGGSEVNSGLYHRCPEFILEKWESENGFKVSKLELQKAYESIEKNISVSFMPKNKIPKASNFLLNGANKLGWECKEIPRWHKYSGGTGEKQGMSKNFIPQFVRAGGQLICNCEVLKIIKLQKNKFLIRALRNKNEILELECEFLILGCGAISSPSLLRKSGIKKNIGKGLQMHPSFKFTAEFDEEVNFENMGVPVHQIKEFSPNISMGCSISSRPHIGLGLIENDSKELINRWRNMASYYVMISPASRGFVANLPYFKSPFVFYNLIKEDQKTLRRGINLLGEVLFASGAISLYPSMVNAKKILNLNSLNSMVSSTAFSNFNLMTIHLFGSIPIGGEKKYFPTSPNGRLWEDNRILIADSSMLCGSPSVNPQGTIMALSKINSQQFLNQFKNEY